MYNDFKAFFRSILLNIDLDDIQSDDNSNDLILVNTYTPDRHANMKSKINELANKQLLSRNIYS